MSGKIGETPRPMGPEKSDHPPQGDPLGTSIDVSGNQGELMDPLESKAWPGHTVRIIPPARMGRATIDRTTARGRRRDHR